MVDISIVGLSCGTGGKEEVAGVAGAGAIEDKSSLRVAVRREYVSILDLFYWNIKLSISYEARQLVTLPAHNTLFSIIASPPTPTTNYTMASTPRTILFHVVTAPSHIASNIPTAMALSLSPSLLPNHLHCTHLSSATAAATQAHAVLFLSRQPPPAYSALTSNNNPITTCSPKALSSPDSPAQLSSPTPTSNHLSHAWRQVHGEDDWVGLLDPMDPLLRSELIRYGEMAQSCYDAFDYDPFSHYLGSCRFPRRAFFQSLHLTRHGYHVTRYLYATANIRLPNFFTKSRWPKLWSTKANWIGYVAVSDDETSAVLGRRDIAIAWRGTVTRLEWLADLMDFLKPVDGKKIPSRDPTVKVQSGFVDLYTEKDDSCRFCKYSAREQVLTEVKRLTEKYGGAGEEVSITITGHSLGSALATLSACDIAETGLNLVEGEGSGRSAPICVFSFSGPRVGNVRFKERLDLLGVKVLRVVNVHDIVPRSPGFLFNEDVPRALTKLAEGLPWCYSHVGVELELDHKKSPFLKPTSDLAAAHNLEAHLHLLDGYHGKGERFELTSGRDPALVNKGSDFLKDHHMVPPFWRQDHNKGLIRTQDGRWMQPERPKLDDHPEDMHEYLTRLRGLLS